MNNNITTTDIEIQIDTMMDIDKTTIDSQLIDIPDYTNLNDINNRLFGNYPLNLQFLCDELVKKTPFDT